MTLTLSRLTDKVTYLPGIKGTVNYKACFHDLPRSIQTHVYAPAGLEIKEKWSIGGNEAHEEREVIEIGMAGLGVPREGLYLREDVDMKCSIFLTNFVKKTLKKAHQVLVERLVMKADLQDDKRVRQSYLHTPNSPSFSSRSPTALSTRGTSMSISDMSLRRGGSVRSDDDTASDTTISTMQLPIARPDMRGYYNIAELPVQKESYYPAPLQYRPQEYDPRAWARSKGTAQPPRTRHPSNAFGIPPPRPVELE